MARTAGVGDLAQAFRDMPKDVRQNGLRAGMRAGSVVIQKEAQLRAPVETGRMQRNVYIKRIRELATGVSEGWFVGVRTGPKRSKDKETGKYTKDYSNDAWYWRFVEFGTRFVPARPFMRPAFETKKEAALTAIQRRLRARIRLWEKRKP